MGTGNFPGQKLLMLFILIGVFIIVRHGQVKQTIGDPQLTLLTSQAILEHGSLKLTSYKNELSEAQFSNGNWKCFYRHGDVYYTYPIGTSVLCLPAVFIANQLGMDMANREHDERLQVILAAFCCVLLIIQLYRLFRYWFDAWPAFGLALLFFFSTSLVSTMGTALWSFGTEMLFILEVLLEIIAVEKGKRTEIRTARVGAFLFLAWFCRPSAISFLLIVFTWLMLRKAWKPLLRVLLFSGIGLLLFIGFSLLVYGDLLHPYYNPLHWSRPNQEHNSFYIWMGLWFSPARGLFAFSPLLLLLPFGALLANVRRNRLFIIMAVWLMLHTLLLTRNANWWGGWSFGPRLFTDILPAFAILFAVAWEPVTERLRGLTRQVLAALLALTAFAGVYIHAVQGLMNPASFVWNMGPEIDTETDFYIFNWNYPQFMATEQTNRQKLREFELRERMPLWNRYLPENTTLLIGGNDAELRTICANINADKNENRGLQLVCSLGSVHQPSFYALPDLADTIRKNKNYRIVPPKQQLRLDQFLDKLGDHLVMLSVKDEATNQLSPESRTWLRNAGAHIDSLKYRQGYLLVLGYDKKVIYEKFDTGQGAYLEMKAGKDQKITLLSKGNISGNESSIKLAGRELSQNARGINVVAIDKNREVSTSVNFDTHIADLLQVPFLQVERVNQ
jgi:hypothetical protein